MRTNYLLRRLTHGRAESTSRLRLLRLFVRGFSALVRLDVVGVGFFYFNATNNLNRCFGGAPRSFACDDVQPADLQLARQKLDHFFADPAERERHVFKCGSERAAGRLSRAACLGRGTVVALNQNSAEVDCSLPVDLPLLPRRYLNCTFEMRPSMRGTGIGAGCFADRKRRQTRGSGRDPSVSIRRRATD